MPSSPPESYALFPLTVFDRLFERTTFVTGWLVEGAVDSQALARALDTVTNKWRMLAGRLQSATKGNETQWCIRIPRGSFPRDYHTYSLTTSVSDVPLSRYLTIPLQSVSPSLPPHLFAHPSVPRQYTVWESTNSPLTYWHITYFPSGDQNVPSHSCIGFSRCHGIFDGTGAALVVNAVISELRGSSWEIPQLPSEGLVENPLQEVLNAASKVNPAIAPDVGFSILGVKGTLGLVAWHLRERWWRGADRTILILPNKVVEFLVDTTRAKVQAECDGSVRVTTGDVLVAWLLKTVYLDDTPASTVVQCGNLASFRDCLSKDSGPSLEMYPHNAFRPLPYPLFTVEELRTSTLQHLSHRLAVSRQSLDVSHVVSACKALQEPGTSAPIDPRSDENLVISNVSASRILEADWSLIGAYRTVCGYRYQLTPTKVMLANAIYISGRLADSSVVLDLTLNSARLELVMNAVDELALAAVG
ncbi:hypothetical protein BD779DRAFT_872480 [Infundibulicybe gibba]|nr:hypothetical protein BD779DRAFT_872480 [Infundibulicybe gibba]